MNDVPKLSKRSVSRPPLCLLAQPTNDGVNERGFQIGRVRIDRSMIGGPTNFRHIGHMGANDVGGECNVRER
jgi:hypothetical protein